MLDDLCRCWMMLVDVGSWLVVVPVGCRVSPRLAAALARLELRVGDGANAVERHGVGRRGVSRSEPVVCERAV